MQAVDTNVLIRILVDDEKQQQQNHIARQFAKKTGVLFVPQIVQVELVWVLEIAYELGKNDIISILNHLNTNEAFVLQNMDQFTYALQRYQATSADFADCLILAESSKANGQVVTFDKKFAKLDSVIALTA